MPFVVFRHYFIISKRDVQSLIYHNPLFFYYFYRRSIDKKTALGYNLRMDLSVYLNNMDRDKVKKLIPKLPANEVSTFLWKEETVIHRHSDWEFTATTDGTGVNLVNGEA